jgi:ATP-dependent DNA ligase
MPRLSTNLSQDRRDDCHEDSVGNARETDIPRAEARDAHWVKPVLVAEVEFTEWSREGRLRHPSFQGLRADKAAREVRAEHPKSRA